MCSSLRERNIINIIVITPLLCVATVIELWVWVNFQIVCPLSVWLCVNVSINATRTLRKCNTVDRNIYLLRRAPNRKREHIKHNQMYATSNVCLTCWLCYDSHSRATHGIRERRRLHSTHTWFTRDRCSMMMMMMRCDGDDASQIYTNDDFIAQVTNGIWVVHWCNNNKYYNASKQRRLCACLWLAYPPTKRSLPQNQIASHKYGWDRWKKVVCQHI